MASRSPEWRSVHVFVDTGIEFRVRFSPLQSCDWLLHEVTDLYLDALSKAKRAGRTGLKRKAIVAFKTAD
jgi:hypothetical protein